jgi:hypothetical protein
MTNLPIVVAVLFLGTTGSWCLIYPAGVIQYFLREGHPEISKNNKAAQQVVRLIGGMFWFMVLMILAFTRHC